MQNITSNVASYTQSVIAPVANNIQGTLYAGKEYLVTVLSHLPTQSVAFKVAAYGVSAIVVVAILYIAASKLGWLDATPPLSTRPAIQRKQKAEQDKKDAQATERKTRANKRAHRRSRNGQKTTQKHAHQSGSKESRSPRSGFSRKTGTRGRG